MKQALIATAVAAPVFGAALVALNYIAVCEWLFVRLFLPNVTPSPTTRQGHTS